MLPAVALTVLLATMTPSALAQTLQPKAESSGAPCPAVSLSGTDVNGGCVIHATSESAVTLKKHVFGIESTITTCDIEFHARLDDDASGYMFEQQITGAGCTREACAESAGESTPWAFTGAEGSALEGDKFLATSLCVETLGGGADETCEIDLPLDSPAHFIELGHVTEMSAHGLSGFRCELVGHWTTETGGTHDGANEEAVELDGVGLVPHTSTLDFTGTSSHMLTFLNNTSMEVTAIELNDIAGPGAGRFEATNCTPSMVAKKTGGLAGACEMTVTKMPGDTTKAGRIRLHYMMGPKVGLWTVFVDLIN